MTRELNSRQESPTAHGRSPTDDALDRVRLALRGLQYGEISIVVQDGIVIQIERTERMRMRRKRD